MIIYVDIDETLCCYTGERDYSLAQPLPDNIAKVNSLYRQNHTIIVWTARGTGTGLDWHKLTKQQLAEWGVKYHQLKFGKPVYDILIDDRALNSVHDWSDARVAEVLGIVKSQA